MAHREALVEKRAAPRRKGDPEPVPMLLVGMTFVESPAGVAAKETVLLYLGSGVCGRVSTALLRRARMVVCV